LDPLQFTCLDGTDNMPVNVTGCADPVYIDWDTTNFGPGSIGTSPMVVTAPGNQFEDGEYVMTGGVKGLTEANRIFRVGNISGDEFTLEPCEPAPPCSNRSVPGRTPYESGGTATLLDPGQNNEGFGTIAITAPSDLSANSLEDYLAPDSLKAKRESGDLALVANRISASINVLLEIRLTAYSSNVHADAAQVLFFDGDPAKGASAFAQKFIHPGQNGTNGTSIWLEWTPTTLGTHHIYALLDEGPGVQQIAQINVIVVPSIPNTTQ
jgi:hypothetical protein